MVSRPGSFLSSKLSAEYQRLLRDAQQLSVADSRLMPPLLIEPPADWGTATLRLLYVGQETRGWPFDDSVETIRESSERNDAIDLLLQSYRSFDFGHALPTLNSAPFWRFFRMIEVPHANLSVSKLWTNVFKTAWPNEKGSFSCLGCPPNLQEQILKWQKGILSEEIRELKATHVLFVSGPRYDKFIEQEFGSCEFLEIEGAGLGCRGAAFLRSEHIRIPMARIYHPAYAQRIGRFDDLLAVAKRLLGNFQS